MGVITGIIAFAMHNLEEFLIGLNKQWTQSVMSPGGDVGLGWLVYCSFSVVMTAIAAGMTIYWGPGAGGSGVAETMGLVNGYNYHDFIGVNTLITKILGVIFAVSGGIKVGKEGPLAHIGSLVGLGVIYMPFKFC